jgi:predicted TIM-barrel fold metal-dependent hydrolase
MIIDSHCHAWRRWPYQPPAPDDESRASIEQLLFEMDANGVSQALVICANIYRNNDNNEYVFEESKKYPERVHFFPDIDSGGEGRPDTYHTAGAADRLRRAIEMWPVKGFNHYLLPEDDGAWLYSDEGTAFFKVAADAGLIASIACKPHHQPAIRKLAERFPSMPILCHHMSGVRASEGPDASGIKYLLESAKLPNIYIKASGFYYGSNVRWEYPYSDTMWATRTIYEHFGPHRMCWGSDYPVSGQFTTYRQCIEVLRTHCTFMPQRDRELILGETLNGLLTRN